MAFRTMPSLKEIQSVVPAEKLDKTCKNSHLRELALSITDWPTAAALLGLTEAEEKAIKEDFDSATRRRIAVLRKWRKNVGSKATYRRLAKALWKMQRVDLIEEVCELLCDSGSSSSASSDSERGQTGPTSVACDLASYIEYLRGRYQTQFPSFLTLQWPPPPTRKVFNLAMIKSLKQTTKTVDRELARLTLQGDVEHIMSTRSEVKLGELFKLDKINEMKRKIILIEGAPGAGKSTLAWHICQKWESGELFQEFRVVVHVQLRDPDIQKAKSIKGILPAKSKAMADDVLAELEACNGKDVLFVIDSWDEYTPGLKDSSLIENLICKSEKLNLHFSTLVITSRPIASGRLHRLVSSIVEIVGFTPDEVKRYFTEALEGDSGKVLKLEEHLRERSLIEASCYLPLTASIVVYLFIELNYTLPSTLHEVFSSLVICCLIRHLNKQSDAGILKQIPCIPSLDEVPPTIREDFNQVCTLAYHGADQNKSTFLPQDLRLCNLPTEVSTLSLLQGVESFTCRGRTLSYNFLHLSVQELLAAFHISKLPLHRQVEIFKDLFGQPRFAAVFRFYAAFTKLKSDGIQDVIVRIVKSGDKHQLLSLLHCLYEAQDLSLCQFVGSLLNGQLELEDVSLSPVDCLTIGFFLSSICRSVSGKFTLNGQLTRVEEYALSFLSKELTKCNDSQNVLGHLELDLRNGKTWGHRPEKIVKLLGHSTLVTKLILTGSNLQEGVAHSDWGLRGLLDAIRTNSTLTELHLSNCTHNTLDIRDENGELLNHMLQCNSTLKTLILSDNRIYKSDEASKFIAEGLKHNTALEKLDLKDCTLDAEAAKHITEALIMNRHLSCLILSDNMLCDKGIVYISRNLKTISSLKKLGVCRCGITDKGMEVLADALTVNASLEVLDLHYNKILDAGATHLAHALQHNRTLTSLDLSSCSIGDRGIESISDAIMTNSSLQELYLNNNRFTDKGLLRLAESLHGSERVEFLGLQVRSRVADEGWKRFALSLQDNCHL